MKKVYFIVFYALAAFCLSSCTNDTNGESGSATTPLSIASVSVPGMTTPITPAIGTAVGVFRLTGTGDYTTSQDNISYALGADETWAPTVSTSQILLGSEEATLCAYLPYNASATLTEIPLVSQSDSTVNDVYYKTSVSASASAPAVTFDMQHALSKITFTISPTPSFTGTCAINNITIANEGILKSSSLNLQTGVYTNESTPTGSVSFNPGIAGITSGNSATASVLMVPVTTAMTGTITLTINVDGVDKIVSFEASLLPLLNAGSNYNIPVDIGPIVLPNPEANCHIVAPNSSVSIPVSRANAANSANFSSSTMPWTTGLLWTDVENPLTASGTIASITGVNTNSTDGSITVMTGSATGNAVVYVKNKDGKICWSWHIWVTDYDPSVTNISYNTITWMDRNLGATTNTHNVVGCMGLHYQWGRKDPFPGPSAVDAVTEKPLYGDVAIITATPVATSPNLVNAIQNPATFYTSAVNPKDWYSNTTAQDNELWGSAKTVYDPCPIGWKVPRNGSWTTDLSGTWAVGEYGYMFTGAGWYEASRRRRGDSGTFGALLVDDPNSDLKNNGFGYYWSSTFNTTGSWMVYFYAGTVYPSCNYTRANGCSVRCVKE